MERIRGGFFFRRDVMKKRMLAAGLAVCLVMTGCGSVPQTQEAPKDTADQAETSEATNEADNTDTAVSENSTPGTIRTSLLGEEEIYYNPDLKPCVEPYTIAEDLSNVVYADRFASWFDSAYDTDYNNTAPLRNAWTEIHSQPY